jgi:hypothetical protein
LSRAQLFKRNRRHFDVDVDAIQQRSTNFSHVPFNLWHRAVALAPRIIAIAARAGVQRCDENEVGRERGTPSVYRRESRSNHLT